MQAKTDSRAKLPPHSALRQYQSLKETSKIQNKGINKSKKKPISSKNKHNSVSKTKLPTKVSKNNENFNSVNVQPQESGKLGKSTHLQSDDLKKQARKQGVAKHNSSRKMQKTKSMVRLQSKTDRNRLSPSSVSISAKQLNVPHDEKSKTIRFPVNKVNKDKKSYNLSKQQPIKLKKSKSKLNVLAKKEVESTERGHINRQSIKTEMSSKMHSVTKEDHKFKKQLGLKTKVKIHKKQLNVGKNIHPKAEKKEKKSKIESGIQRSILYSQVSFQEYNQKEYPYESAIVHNEKYFLPYPNPKSVKTQGCLISSKSEHRLADAIEQNNRAATKIQSCFRGYITRKYINEAKYIIGKVKIIQNWWRSRPRKLRAKVAPKAQSVENSLITIKDFNETFKTDRQKFSQSKENTLSNNKINIKELIRNIMQEEEEECHQSKEQNGSCELNGQKEQSLDKSMFKQTYVDHKIKDEIKSEKIFNSPKRNSPCPVVKTPTSSSLNIKEFFNSNSNEKNKIRELMHSPRMTSPLPPKNTPNNNPSIALPARDQPVCMFNENTIAEPIQSFQTKFAAIEEICLLLVNFFRDRQQQMNNFIFTIQQLKYFRSKMVLRYWKTYNLSEQAQDYLDETPNPDYQYMESYMKPLIFTQSLRDDILAFPEIQIDLNDKRFALGSRISGLTHHCFLDFIFDAMEEAFYQPFKGCILTYGQALSKHVYKDNQSIFQYIFSTALGYIFDWGSVMCGLMIDLPPEQQSMRELRMRQFEKRQQHWDLGASNKMGLKLQVAESIFLDLIEEWYFQIWAQQE